MTEKTKQVLSYIISNRPAVSVTALMKLCYLIDLISVARNKNQITEFEYVRYFYGPFDKSIYPFIHELEDKGVVSSETEYVRNDEVVQYSQPEGTQYDQSLIEAQEIELIDAVLRDLEVYGAKQLTEISYNTPPMVAIGATIGGSGGLGEVLNLEAQMPDD